jgi:O-antigen ligase
MPADIAQRSTEFARRKFYTPAAANTRPILIAALITAVIGGILLFFIEPYFVFGPILLILLVAVIVKYPIVGLYLYLLITYLRPQDLLGFLVVLRPNIFLLALTVISLIVHRKMEGNTRITLLRNDKLFLAFLVAAVLSNVTSIWFSSSMETTIELLKMMLFYFAAVMLLDNYQRVKRYIVYYLLSMGFVSLVQIFTYLTVGLSRTTGKGGYGIIINGVQVLGGGGPAQASAEGVNGVGGYSIHFLANASELGLGLCIAYPLAYALMRGSNHRLLRLISFLLIVMFIVSIVFTGSRGAFVGFVATLLYILHKEKKLLVGLVVLAALSGPAIYLVSDQYVQRIKSIGEYEEDESVGIRLQLWRAAVNMVADYPVFGVGTGNFPVAYGSSYRAKGSASLYWSPHNVFVQIITEMGLVGITVYVLFIAAIFGINRRTRKLLAEAKQLKLLIHFTHGVDVATVGYIVAGQFITATYYPHLFQLSVWASALYLIAAKAATAPSIAVNAHET